MKKARLISLLLVVFLLIVNTTPALASSNNLSGSAVPEMVDVYQEIFSKETNEFINKNIDFNSYGIQSVDLGNDLTFIYINQKSMTRSTVSDTMTSIFTLSGQSVATLRLACTFTYNGSTASITSSNYRASAEAIPDWSCTADASHSTDSNGDVYVSATYNLYYNGNYNANGYMDMSCNKNGVVSKHYPWS